MGAVGVRRVADDLAALLTRWPALTESRERCSEIGGVAASLDGNAQTGHPRIARAEAADAVRDGAVERRVDGGALGDRDGGRVVRLPVAEGVRAGARRADDLAARDGAAVRCRCGRCGRRLRGSLCGCAHRGLAQALEGVRGCRRAGGRRSTRRRRASRSRRGASEGATASSAPRWRTDPGR